MHEIPNPYIIDTRNVHAALPRAMFNLLEGGVRNPSRNGDVLVMTHPVITVYRKPCERVMFWAERDANPFFHFFEGLGFLNGRMDVDYYAQFAKQIASYSDDGTTLPASYGHRWRTYFDRDQLPWAIRRLRENPNDRRVVVSMWDPARDPTVADQGGKDVPCNTNIFFGVVSGRLDMMVNCRSNDILWGCYGANAVHMSMMQEYVALAVGVEVGRYYQNSFNWHAYVEFFEKVLARKSPSPEQSLARSMAEDVAHSWDPYTEFAGRSSADLIPLMERKWTVRDVLLPADYAEFDLQLGIFLGGGARQSDGLTNPFFIQVAVPMREAHRLYKKARHLDAIEHLKQHCGAWDWRRAAIEWINRRTADTVRAVSRA